MKRLFWKVFIIIWLAITASIAVLLTLLTLLQVAPLSSEVLRGQEVFALDLAAHLLQQSGPDIAAILGSLTAEAATPVRLVITEAPASAGCMPDDESRTVERDGTCFRVAVDGLKSDFFSRTWPHFIPWFSAVLGAAVSAYLVARYLVRPVAHLRRGLSALAGGDFSVRIGDDMKGRKDEIAALAHDFDTSAERLDELRQAQERLLHDVSHELRSPLSRIRAAIGVLEQNPAKSVAMMERLVREVERIDDLVGEILTLARLTSRSDEAEVQAVDIIDLLNEILNDASFEGEARSITLTPSVSGIFVAEVSGELIYRALENVVRNAVKHTVDNSHVSVRCKVEDGILRISVADEGPGVAADELETIFQPFSRGSGSVAAGGYGLGLAIARRAVERHGGSVSASKVPSGGLQIDFSIPKTATG
jgi:two-component system, OmpR family, sensor kinase